MTANLSVLIADDNRDAVESLAMLLSMGGYRVLCAHSGSAALELALRERPDAAILDIGMPGLSGLEVACAIRKQSWGGDALLIAASAWDEREDRKASIAAGFDLHLSKPTDLAHIERLLQELAARRTAPATDRVAADASANARPTGSAPAPRASSSGGSIGQSSSSSSGGSGR